MRSPTLIVSLSLASSLLQLGCATSGSTAAVRDDRRTQTYGYSQPIREQTFPEWIERPENVYPAGRYMNGIGTGRTEELARRAALANLASVFRTKVQSVLTIYESESVSKSGSSLYSATRQTIRATTDKELQGAWIAETWSGNGTFYAVALLDRQQAASSISEQIRGIDLFLTEAQQILEGKRPLLVRKSAVRLAMAPGDETADSGSQNIATTVNSAAPVAPPSVQTVPAAASPAAEAPLAHSQGRFADTIVHAEESFSALDQNTEDDAEVEVAENLPKATTTASELKTSGVPPDERIQTSSDTAEPQQTASAPPSPSEEVTDVQRRLDSSESSTTRDSAADDIYLSKSSRLQRARLAQKIAGAAARRSQLNADLRIISASGTSVPPPEFLQKLESWSESALRDLRVAVQVDAVSSGSEAESASDISAALASAAAEGLAGLGVQLSQSSEFPDLTIEIQFIPDPPTLTDEWFWSSGAVRLSLIDSASAAVIGSARKSGKKAAQVKSEASNRLVKLLSSEVKSFLQTTLVSGL